MNHARDKKLYGLATIGEKGQIVVPAEARRALRLKKGDKLLVLVTNEQAKKCYLPAHAPKEGQKYFMEEHGFIAQSSEQKTANMPYLFVLMTGAGAKDFFSTASKPKFIGKGPN